MNTFKHFCRTPWAGMDPLKGFYLYRTAKQKIAEIQPCKVYRDLFPGN